MKFNLLSVWKSLSRWYARTLDLQAQLYRWDLSTFLTSKHVPYVADYKQNMLVTETRHFRDEQMNLKSFHVHKIRLSSLVIIAEVLKMPDVDGRHYFPRYQNGREYCCDA